MNGNREEKVVSFNRWREIRAMAQTIRSGMIYQSLVGNDHDVEARENEDYFGLVYSILSEDPPGPDISFDPVDSQVFLMVDDEEDEGLLPGKGRAVERYEIYDMDTDDIHVMYRVPYRPNILKAVKKDSKPK